MDVHLSVWLITIAGVLALIVFDFYSHVRHAHVPTIRESATWSIVYIALAVVFGLVVWFFGGHQAGGEFFAGWLTEKALSVDNLFVFLIIMTSFAVPKEFQQKVLLVGVAIALAARGVFIALGVTIIDNFAWVFYVFGGLLFWLAYSQIRGGHEDDAEQGDSRLIRMLRRVIPTSDDYDGDRVTTRVDGRRLFTPMLLVMVSIGLTDVLFALDSIPAIFGLTQDAYIVFTANAFSLLGLRQLYFLISGLLERLIYLAQGLAVILAFIGVKLVFHALHVNEVPFVNGGRHVEWAPEIPIWFSLGFIVVVIGLATAASLVVSGRRARAGAVRPDVGGTD